MAIDAAAGAGRLHSRRAALTCVAAVWLTSQMGAAMAAPVAAGAVAQVLRHHAVLVHAAYADTLLAALELQSAVTRFLNQPDEAGLQQSREAWRAAREWYGQTEAFRFYGGPIDDAAAIEERLNTWPLDEAYIDHVVGRPDAGFVSDPTVLLTRDTLVRAHVRGGLENVATGWHAIEFLLWGQDLDADGPGRRPPSDYVDGAAPHADRRRLVLRLVTDLLVDDLRLLVAAWSPAARSRNYRTRFEQGGRESLQKIFIGLGVLSRAELAGERLDVPLSTQDQEDEQSCFSDNTHRDIVNNILGLDNVWQGRFRRRDGRLIDGPSPSSLVASKAPALSAQVSAMIVACREAASLIPAPFDRAIRVADGGEGRARVQASVMSLVTLSKGFALAAHAVGITHLQRDPNTTHLQRDPDTTHLQRDPNTTHLPRDPQITPQQRARP